MEWAGAPQSVIDKYNKRFDFELYDIHIKPITLLFSTSPADYHYREEQRGKKVYTRFAGFKSTAIHAVMKMLKVKNSAKLLRQIRLIEYGALNHGE